MRPSDLAEAIKDGDVVKVRQIISSSVYPDPTGQYKPEDQSNPASLLDKPDSFGQFPAHYAAVFGRDEILKVLNENKFSILCKSPYGTTPLHYASRNGQYSCVSLLLDYGAEPNCRDHSEWTPLHYACSRGHPETCKILIARGADIAATTQQKHTPLHICCSRGHLKIAAELVNKGAPISLKNDSDYEPFCLISLSDKSPPQLHTILDRDNCDTNFIPLLNLSTALSDLIVKSFMTDLTITLKNGEVANAHRAIFIARIPSLETKLHSPNEEILFKDVNPSVFSLLLEWVYSGVVTSLRTKPTSKENAWKANVNALQLLNIAYDHDINDLKDECCTFLTSYLTIELTPYLWEWLTVRNGAPPHTKLPKLTLEIPQPLDPKTLGVASEQGKPLKDYCPKLYPYLVYYSIRKYSSLGKSAFIQAWLTRNQIAEMLTSLSVATSNKPEIISAAVPKPAAPATSGIKMDVKIYSKVKQIIQRLSRQKHVGAFLEPVDPIKHNAPEYQRIILKPMDLGTIRTKFEQNKYLDTEEFAADVRLVWENAMRYNKEGSTLYNYAEELSKIFEEIWQKFLTEIASSTTPAPSSLPLDAAAASIVTDLAAPSKRKRSDSPSNFSELGDNELFELRENIRKLSSAQQAKVIVLAGLTGLTVNQTEKKEVKLNLSALEKETLREIQRYVQDCLENDPKRLKIEK